MEEVTAADRDIDSIPPRDSIDAHDASDSTQNGDSIEIDSATVIKDEDQLAPVNGDDGGVIERPTKRRKLAQHHAPYRRPGSLSWLMGPRLCSRMASESRRV